MLMQHTGSSFSMKKKNARASLYVAPFILGAAFSRVLDLVVQTKYAPRILYTNSLCDSKVSFNTCRKGLV